MKPRAFIRIAAALCIIFATGCKWEKVQKTVGYRGPARSDPFLAAKRFLGETGSTAGESDSFTRFPEFSSVVITPLQSFISYGDSELALEWVARGGHMIVLLADAEQWKNDFSEFGIFDLLEERKPGDEELRFLKMLGVRGRSPGGNTEEVTMGARKFSVDLRGGIDAGTQPAHADVRAGADDAPALLSFERGDGRVTLVGSAHPFRNRYIGDKDNAALLSALVGLGGDAGGVIFLNNVRVSFWSMLWAHGWMAIVAVAALLAFWLSRNIPRFGPAYVREERATRQFAEHLKLTGAFLWRSREVDALTGPIRREIRSAAVRLGCDDSRLHARLAEISGLSEARVVAAVTAGHPGDAHHFLRLIQDLQTIRQSL